MRRWCKGVTAVLGLSVFGTAGTLASQEVSAIRSTPLAEGVVLLHSPEPVRGILVGNSILVDGDTVSLLIDTGLAATSTTLRSAVAELRPSPLRWLVNTHPHLDHIGGNDRFLDEGVQLQTESTDLNLGNLRLLIRSVGSIHSSSDVIVFASEPNVVVMGDIYPGGGYPALAATEGATIEALLGVLDWTIARADPHTIVVPGHGEPETYADLEAFREMVSTVARRLRELAQEGLTEDEVVSRRPSRDFDERWGDGFLSAEAWTRQLYRMVSIKVGPADIEAAPLES